MSKPMFTVIYRIGREVRYDLWSTFEVVTKIERNRAGEVTKHNELRLIGKRPGMAR